VGQKVSWGGNFARLALSGPSVTFELGSPLASAIGALAQ
jgi:hypothetical protein